MPIGYRRVAFAAMCAAVCGALHPSRSAWAQDGEPDDLSAARALFAEALRDEEGARLAEALQKFLRVRAVRDTAAVEYRIGTCYEGLGRHAPAYDAYRRAAALGKDDARSEDVVQAARGRFPMLAPHVVLLTLGLPSNAPLDTEVRVDGKVIPRDDLREPLVLEPGTHVVTATAGDASPSRSEIMLPEGVHQFMTIALGVRAPAPPGSAEVGPAAKPPPRTAASASPVIGWVGVVGGGALLASSAALFAIRSGDISKLNHACPGGVCPAGSNRGDLEATREHALVEGPVAVALGVVGILATGAGAYLAITTGERSPRPPATAVRIVPWAAPGAGGVAVAGTLR